MNSNALFNSKKAVLNTASISVNTLKLDGKQVTMGVFRQLQRERIIKYWDGNKFSLNGTPWGRVNYFWDKCGYGRSEHIHIVWQLGNELRRDCIDKYDLENVLELNDLPQLFIAV